MCLHHGIKASYTYQNTQMSNSICLSVVFKITIQKYIMLNIHNVLLFLSFFWYLSWCWIFTFIYLLLLMIHCQQILAANVIVCWGSILMSIVYIILSNECCHHEQVCSDTISRVCDHSPSYGCRGSDGIHTRYFSQETYSQPAAAAARRLCPPK